MGCWLPFHHVWIFDSLLTGGNGLPNYYSYRCTECGGSKTEEAPPTSTIEVLLGCGDVFQLTGENTSWVRPGVVVDCELHGEQPVQQSGSAGSLTPANPVGQEVATFHPWS